MKKIIKPSKRGLTFSVEEGAGISVGMRYRYIIDMQTQTVNIIPDEAGTHKVSRKCFGSRVKPLFDLRCKNIRELVQNADFVEIALSDGIIVVHAYRKKRAAIRLLKGKLCSVEEVFGKEIASFSVTEDALQEALVGLHGQLRMAAGAERYPKLKAFASQYAGSKREAHEVKNIKRVYDMVSLFSGAGLFDKAWIENGRFRVVYANDFCKDVLATYRYNIGEHIVCKDIREVAAEELPYADVYSASPCCQAFSNANRHNMLSNEGVAKRLLVDEVVRLVRENRPKVLVVENVPQFITKENGLYLSRVLEGLDGYEFTVRVLNDSKCGGYSTRERCIVIASRIGKINLPELELITPKTVRDALDKVDVSWFNYEDVTIPEEETRKKMEHVPQGGNWKDIPAKLNTYDSKTHSNVMRRLTWDEPSITLANFRKSNILHPEENRILSVAEAGAIMGLGKDFKFLCKSLGAKQQMVANGVTQAIGRVVRNAVLRKLDDMPLLA